MGLTPARLDPDTRAYVERRRAEGRTTKEIRRILKRYLARQIYRTLNTADPAHSPWVRVAARAAPAT